MKKSKRPRLLELIMWGAEDLLEKVKDGWLDFDSAIATPDLMGAVGRLG